MWQVSNDEFQAIINEALESLPGQHANSIKNIAILYADEPTSEQRQKLALRPNESLYGLYEGVPLTKRQGYTQSLPDVITVFKLPMERSTDSLSGLKEQVRHTLWHEIAHYYGLDHDQIHKLEG